MERQLAIETALRQAPGGRRFTTEIERGLFSLVANRPVDLRSELSAGEWTSWDAAMPALERIDEHQAYRATDLLMQADAQA